MKTYVTPSDFTRVNSDTNGPPRYVCHFLKLLTEADKKEALRMTASYGLNSSYTNGSLVSFEYELAIKNGRKLGGRKFHNKQYGGGIVFQSYNIEETCKVINEALNS